MSSAPRRRTITPPRRRVPAGKTQACSVRGPARNSLVAVVERVHVLAASVWEGAEVKVFGSFSTGLYLPGRAAA